jgi:hypothetical protein
MYVLYHPAFDTMTKYTSTPPSTAKLLLYYVTHSIWLNHLRVILCYFSDEMDIDERTCAHYCMNVWMYEIILKWHWILGRNLTLASLFKTLRLGFKLFKGVFLFLTTWHYTIPTCNDGDGWFTSSRHTGGCLVVRRQQWICTFCSGQTM